MDKLERFRKQQQLRAQLNGRPLIHLAAPAEEVESLLSASFDTKRLEAFSYLGELNNPVEVSSSEAHALIEELDKAFDSKRVDEVLTKTQSDVIAAIAGPFGLGKVLAAYDKVGGNVTTINNSRQGIYAEEDDHYRRGDYTASKNSQGKKFEGDGPNSVGSVFTRSQLDQDANLVDAYTSNKIKASHSSPDHIYSNSEFHKNGGFMLSDTKKADFATDTDNLASTRRDINQSMRDHDKMVWKDMQQNGRGVTNEHHFGIDKTALRQNHKRGQATARKHEPQAADKAMYYTANAMKTGVSEGTKMGGQQAFGLLLVELFAASFSEIKDVFVSGRQGRSLFEEVSLRLTRVAGRVASKWKDMIAGFSSGFISGLISNIVTTLINTLVTTGKRVVRMIREGVFSLLKALKTLIFPPKNLSPQQSAHEAMKLLASGGIVIAGVTLEEVIEKLLLSVPVLAPLAVIATPVIVGSICAIGMALTCYLIDKLDFFNAIKMERDQFVLQELDKNIQGKLLDCQSLMDEIDGYVSPPLLSGA